LTSAISLATFTADGHSRAHIWQPRQ